MKVKVTDNGDGTLATEVTYPNGIEFVNTYEAKGDITFKGTKELTGRALKEGEFTFELYDGEGNLIESVKNDADGNFRATSASRRWSTSITRRRATLASTSTSSRRRRKA